MTFKFLFLSLLTITLILSCKKKNEDKTEDSDTSAYISIEAMTAAGEQASASEGGSQNIATTTATQMINQQMDVLEEEIRFAKKYISDENSLNENGFTGPADHVTQSATACRYSARHCSAGTGTVAWDSCTISSQKATVTMTGGWTETWTNTGDCTNGYLSPQESVTRSSTGSVVNLPTGATITTDTKGGTAYNGMAFTSGSVITTRSNTTNRAVAMTPTTSAIRKVYTGRRGATIFDYFTVPNITVTGTRFNGATNGLGSTSTNRAVSGTITVHHNLAKYSATNTFNSVTWSSASCCFPTSGSITTTFSGTGAPTGTYTLTFNSSCTTPTFLTPDNALGSAVELSNCQ